MNNINKTNIIGAHLQDSYKILTFYVVCFFVIFTNNF